MALDDECSFVESACIRAFATRQLHTVNRKITSMSNIFRLCAVLVCAAVTSGCITALTTVKLRPDGSGTIEQAMSMNAATAEQFASMTKGLSEAAGEGQEGQPGELFSEKEMKEAAAKYGEGVVFVSSRPIKTADRVGRVAIYEFADISRIKINQKPDAAEAAPAGGKAEDVLFRFSRQPSGNSVVNVVFPEPKFDAAKGSPAGETATPSEAKPPDPAQLAMMKTLFEGLRVDIALEVLGTIVKTNSPYVQGSRVTLLEMDFSQLLENDQLLSKVAQPGSLEEAKQLLKDVKGFKVNLDREVVVEFK